MSTTGPTLVSAVQAFQKEWRKKHKDTDAYAVLPEDTDECFYVLSGTSFSDILAMTKFWWGKKFREENLRITIAEFNNISEDGISSYSSSCLCVEYPSRARIQP